MNCRRGALTVVLARVFAPAPAATVRRLRPALACGGSPALCHRRTLSTRVLTTPPCVSLQPDTGESPYTDETPASWRLPELGDIDGGGVGVGVGAVDIDVSGSGRGGDDGDDASSESIGSGESNSEDTLRSANRMIREAHARGNMAALARFYDQLGRRLQPLLDTDATACVISAMHARGRTLDAFALLPAFYEKKLSPSQVASLVRTHAPNLPRDPDFFAPLMRVTGMFGTIDISPWIFELAKELEVRCNVSMYDKLLRALLRIPDAAAVLGTVQLMVADGISLNATVYSMLMTAHMHQGNHGAVCELLRTMKEQGVSPTMDCYVAYVLSLLRTRDTLPLAFQVLNEIVETCGPLPSFLSHHLISACSMLPPTQLLLALPPTPPRQQQQSQKSRQPQPQQSQKSWQPQPQPQTQQQSQQQSQVTGLEMGLELFRRMEAQSEAGSRLTETTYVEMINLCRRHGARDLELEMWRRKWELATLELQQQFVSNGKRGVQKASSRR